MNVNNSCSKIKKTIKKTITKTLLAFLAVGLVPLCPVEGASVVSNKPINAERQKISSGVPAAVAMGAGEKKFARIAAVSMEKQYGKTKRAKSEVKKAQKKEQKKDENLKAELKNNKKLTSADKEKIVHKEIKRAKKLKKHINKNFILPEGYETVGIFGTSEATRNQAAQLILQQNPVLNIGCSVGTIVDLYWEEAEREGIRPDLALSQAIVETGYFRFGGDVEAWQHNFCGLGTVGGGVKGASFKTPRLGVRAHIQHLMAYASHKKPKTKLIDPRYKGAHALRLSRGMVDTWKGLSGTWAMGSEYAEKIFTTHQKMLMCSDEAPVDMWKDFQKRTDYYSGLYKERIEKRKK